MLISVRHITRYRYAEPVSYTIQILRLTPLSFMGQRVLDWQVRAGGISPRLQFRDGFGNTAHLLTVKQRVLTSDVTEIKLIVDRIRRTEVPKKVVALLDKLNA